MARVLVAWEADHAKGARMTYPTIFPSLRYDDAQAAIDFLVRAFGAERHAVYAADDGSVQHAELRLGNGIVMLGSPAPDRPASRGRGDGIYVVVEDADAHCARAREGGAEIVRDVSDTEYGSRGYSAHDPEGNVWHFGTYQPFAFDHESEVASQTA
jgi:uncharacterized glyoxalase superfamily protein PhnB